MATIHKEIKYSLDDIMLMPADVSDIDSRSKVNPFVNGTLPIFTAPMPCVVNWETVELYRQANIIPIIPRGVDDIKRRIEHCTEGFVAFSLEEFTTYFVEGTTKPGNKKYALIDIANGNMSSLGRKISRAKKLDNSLVIMAGNVANPYSYAYLSECGASYVRVSVGSGSACTTATNTGIYYPMGSLLEECSAIQKRKLSQGSNAAKIIADGGINNFRNLNKALAFADYVMIGSWFNKCVDSAGEIVKYYDSDKKLYYGMASNYGAKMIGKKSKYPEGKLIYNDIICSIKELAEQMEGYLRSTMSYCNAETLEEFRQKAQFNVVATTQFNK